jgi:hypothetical protein
MLKGDHLLLQNVKYSKLLCLTLTTPLVQVLQELHPRGQFVLSVCHPSDKVLAETERPKL